MKLVASVLDNIDLKHVFKNYIIIPRISEIHLAGFIFCKDCSVTAKLCYLSGHFNINFEKDSPQGQDISDTVPIK